MVCILVTFGDLLTSIEFKMKKIGLVGEAPNDTKAFINLFRNFKEDLEYFPLINDIHGSMLDNQKTKHILRKQFEIEKPDIVIFIRDLDSLESDEVQLHLRRGYFTDFNSVVNRKGIYLLNIFELEALIISDIDTFNSIYSTSIAYSTDPMLQEKPKEFLINSTSSPKKYKDSDNPEIFEKLSFEKLKSCRYFSNFLQAFEAVLNVA